MSTQPPTLTDLRTTAATLAEAETSDYKAGPLAQAALDVRQRVRDAEDEAYHQMRQQQWAAQMRARLNGRRGH